MEILKFNQLSKKRKYIEDFYTWRCSDNPNNPDVVGWGSRRSQYGRFNVFNSLIENGDSVLDYGCGVGDFLRYLELREKKVIYKGVDIQPRMVQFAKEKFKDGDFEVVEKISDIKGTYDWIVASGVFTVGMNHVDVLNYFQSGLQICDKGVVANFLNTRNIGPDLDIVEFISQNVKGKILEYTHYNKVVLKSFLEKKIGKSFELVDRYSREDFTLILHK